VSTPPERAPEAGLTSAPLKPSRTRYLPKLLVSALLAAACVWLLQHGALKLLPDRTALRSVNIELVVASLALLMFTYLLRAARWQLLLAPVARVPLWTVIRVALIGFAALVILPLRTGEVVRPLLLRRAGKVSGWVATGTVGAERIIDGLFLSSILFGSLLLSHPLDPLPDKIGDLPVNPRIVPHAAYAALGLFAVASALMVLFYGWRSFARRLLMGSVGRFSLRLAEYVAQRVESVASGLSFLTKPRYTLPFILATAGYWFSNAATFLILGRASGFSEMTFAQACVTMGVLGLGIVLPSAPGFFGAFQLSVYAGLSLYFLPAEVMGRGSVYVFLVYVCQIGVSVGGGAIAALLEPTRLSVAFQASKDASTAT
jgi:glycosyltransferase 2 family protein